MDFSYKPLVKQWLYRKILLDEFSSLDYLVCKKHIADLKRKLDAAAVSSNQKNSFSATKKKKAKNKSTEQVCSQFAPRLVI